MPLSVEQKNFVDKYLEDSKAADPPVPYLDTLAQGALESRAGRNAPGNAFFGIKVGKNWTGKKQLLWTHEEVNGKWVPVKAWFRAYDSAKDSFIDHANFLMSNPRYKEAFETLKDHKKVLEDLVKLGYRTDSGATPGLVFEEDDEADATAFGQELEEAGYATDSKYAEKLMVLIDDIEDYLDSKQTPVTPLEESNIRFAAGHPN